MVGRQAYLSRGFGYLSIGLDLEFGAVCRAEDAREDGCTDRAGGSSDGCSGGNQVVGCRELDARHDEDEGGAKAETGEASKYETVEIISGSDGGEANKSSRED